MMDLGSEHDLVPAEDFRLAIHPNDFLIIKGPGWTGGEEENVPVDSARVTSLAVAHMGRFGNSIRQFANIVNCARAIGCPTIYLPGYWWIAPGVSHAPCGLRIVNSPDVVLGDESNIVVSKFFFEPQVVDKAGSLSRHAILREMESLLNLPEGDEGLADDDLVVHIRSGDVFDPLPHRRYGQPPLSFYQKVIASRDWGSITIVAEDHANPVIAGLQTLLEGRNEVRFFIGRTLEQDMALLLSAKTLVTSVGTFCRAICALSHHLETVFVFNGRFHHWGNRSVRPVNCIDVCGMYARSLMESNWVNSDWQRMRMLRYPESNLVLKKGGKR